MRIEKWGFLLSYIIYLIFCIGLSVFSKDMSIINSMILAITIASTSFSISDILFTKFDIDKKEREALSSLYNLTNYAKNFYDKKIMNKYHKQADEILSALMVLFEGNEDKIENFLMGELSLKDKKDFLDHVKSNSNNELTQFVNNHMESDISDIKEIMNDETIEKDVNEVLEKQKKKEQIYNVFASIIAVLGLSILLIVLTLRIVATSRIINTLTIIAFLSVIISLLLREYYKVNSLKKIVQKRKEILNDLQTHNKN